MYKQNAAGHIRMQHNNVEQGDGPAKNAKDAESCDSSKPDIWLMLQLSGTQRGGRLRKYLVNNVSWAVHCALVPRVVPVTC